MARRFRRALPPAGVLAWEDATCPRCGQLIQRLVSQIVRRGQEWIHVRCAPGQDE